MADLSGFDATQVEPAASFEPVPAGKYLATIVESEMKPTKSGTGNYLQLTFEILEGPHQGRVLWSRLNLQNPNPTTVQIAQAELSSICRATGVMRPKDSSELHNKPMLISVDVEKYTKRDGSEGMSNRVKSYKPVSATAAPAAAGNGDSKPPWAK